MNQWEQFIIILVVYLFGLLAMIYYEREFKKIPISNMIYTSWIGLIMMILIAPFIQWILKLIKW